MRAPAAAFVAFLALPLLAAPLSVTSAPADAPVLIALLDTGIDARHVEFRGYLGQPNVTDPQVVGWWDFGVHGVPPPGAAWDALTPVPFDPVGHGTGTASLAAGQFLGRCPGAKLAMAKVVDAGGALTGDRAAAVQWAVKTLGADVISISINSVVPLPARLEALDEALAEARDLGVLVVVSAGNGLANLGAKYPSETSSAASSPDVLSVGAGSSPGTTQAILLDGSYTNFDPEVSAHGTSVSMASPGNGYVTRSGTSFSTPKVAGYAACLVGAARAHGQDASPDRVETLLKHTARDDLALPYAIEGHGWVNDATYASARSFAASGAPAPPASAANMAADLASQALKVAWSEGAEPHLVLVPRDGASGVVGPSVLAGFSEGEVARIALAAGQSVDIRLTYQQAANTPVLPLNDLDLYLFRAHAEDDGIVEFNELGTESSESAAVLGQERVRFTAGEAGEVLLLVHGWMVAGEQPYAIEATVDGVPIGLVRRDVAVLGFF